jgi:hypothetical protein
MKYVTLLAFLAGFSFNAFSKENVLLDKLLSILTMKPSETTPANVSGILGKPDQIEQGGRQNVWHYSNNNSNLIIYWDGKVIKLQRLLFSTLSSTEKVLLDNDKAKKLRSGETFIVDAIKILGIPQDLQVKGINQELHYTFKENKLNLFFRNGTLVNYTLF